MPGLQNKNILKYFARFRGMKNIINIAIWLLLAVLFILEIIVLTNSVKVVLDVQKLPVPLTQNHGVRINFKDYYTDIQRIQNAGSFTPSPETGADPFTGKRAGKIVVPVSASSSTSTLGSSTAASSTKGN